MRENVRATGSWETFHPRTGLTELHIGNGSSAQDLHHGELVAHTISLILPIPFGLRVRPDGRFFPG